MRKKRCFKCEQSLPESEFYKHKAMATGTLNKCKECTKNDVRKNRKENFEHYAEYEKQRYKKPSRRKALTFRAKVWREKNPEAYMAHSAVSRAVKSGKLVKDSCLFCNSDENVHAHHNNYSKPLDVIWLCAKCHHRMHANFPMVEGHTRGGIQST